MSEGLSRAEQILVETVEHRKHFLLITLNGRIDQLVREIERSENAATRPPHAMAVRISLAADVAEKMAEAQAFLTDLSQKLTVLQDEQVKKL
jgi:hypothetical protein